MGSLHALASIIFTPFYSQSSSFQNILFIFYALIPLMALISISSRDFKLFPKNRDPRNMPFSCGKKSMRGMRPKRAKKMKRLTKVLKI
jgi:hypothetical protein